MKGNIKAKNHKEYFASLKEPRKSELLKLDKLIRKAGPSLKPYMQSGMLGYGKYSYRYESGREGEWFVVGLASQKNYISVYICMVEEGKYLPENYKKQLPKASIGRSCIRFKKLDDVDLKVLEKLVRQAQKVAKKIKFKYIK